MAFDAYIKIDDIPGEALDEKYNRWIEVTGYQFGVSQALQPPQALPVAPHQAARPSAISHLPNLSTVPVAN